MRHGVGKASRYITFTIFELILINSLRFATCFNDQNTENQAMPTNNIEIIKRMYAFFAAKDNQSIENIWDAAIQWNQMKGFPGGGQYVGAKAVFKNVFSGFREHWTDWKAVITEYIDIGDGVFVIGYYEGTYQQTGKYMRSEFACRYTIVKEKITSFTQYTDTFLIGQAMGLTVK